MKSSRFYLVFMMFGLSACQTATLTDNVSTSFTGNMHRDGIGALDSNQLTARTAQLSDEQPSQTSIFKALIQQESSGRNHVVSHAGAVGRTQITLPTARYMAEKLGMNSIANLPKQRLKYVLMRNPGLNEKLGRAYFDEGRERYGRDDIALIYYNGGPRAANAAYKSWKRSGKLYIYTGETYCYVKKISRQAGINAAPMKLIRGQAYHKNRARWLRKTGKAPCHV
ncbi:MAG: lytic transglycosylase domain-containing protein [Pseudomonadota bacterium]